MYFLVGASQKEGVERKYGSACMWVFILVHSCDCPGRNQKGEANQKKKEKSLVPFKPDPCFGSSLEQSLEPSKSLRANPR